ncbi:MAG: hypothetical protein D6824_00685 [Planctomycetota bacterium]|nr:MAG: hypothetical protein D6824_00685 [Planctomycetota bacterium]
MAPLDLKKEQGVLVQTPLHTLRSSRSLLVVALGALSLLAGCNKGADDEGAARVHAAADRLAALHAGGSSLPPAQLRQAAYETIAAQARAAQGEPGADASTAASLAAQADAGLGSLAADRVSELEQQLHGALESLRADEDLRQGQTALALAFERQIQAIDVAAEDARIASINEQLTAVRQRVDDLTARIESLEAKAREALERAKQLRLEEGTLRAQASSAPAQQRAALNAQAYAKQREADAADLEAGKLRAQADSLAPLRKEAERRLQGLQTQLAMAQRTRQAVAQQRTSLQADAAQARASAKDAAERLAQTAQHIVEVRSGELNEAYTRALDRFEHAVAGFARARQAARDPSTRSALAMEQGAAAHRLASLLASRSALASAQAALLSSIAQAEPSFEQASVLAQAAQQLQDEAAQAAAAHRQALQRAVEAYEAALGSVRGQERQRLETLLQLLRQDAAPQQQPSQQPAP